MVQLPATLLNVVDRLAFKVIGALHSLLGVSYSEGAEHFVYQLTLNLADATAVGATGQGAIRISQESSFVCNAIQCVSRFDDSGKASGYGEVGATAASAGEVPDPGLLIAITDGGSDRVLQNEQIDAGAVYSVLHGGRLGRPRLFKPNSNVTIAITMLKAAPAATGWDVRVQLIGFKLYRADALDSTVRVK